MAWKAARAHGRHTWVKELYGREPEYWTANLADITLELMIEEQRQESIAMKTTGKEGQYYDADWKLKMSPLYSEMRRYVAWV